MLVLPLYASHFLSQIQDYLLSQIISTALSSLQTTKMSIISPCQLPPLHVALIPCAGMGHLVPFLRLASILLSKKCMVTFITAKSTLSNAESDNISFFLSTHPEINHLEYETLPISNPNTHDPFFLQYDAISRSAHFVLPLLSSSSPPVSAIFCDLLVLKGIAHISADLCIPHYVVITTSARSLCFMLHLPVIVSNSDRFTSNSNELEIPGLPAIPLAYFSRLYLSSDHLMSRNIVLNIGYLTEAKGILLNSFDYFEAETLRALNTGKVTPNLPPVLAIGPYKTYELEKDQSQCLPWLDKQPAESVLYVSFGSRTALSRDQISELANGLDTSGHRFLWVVKTAKVDKEDKEDLIDLLGDSFLQRTRNKGMVVKGWVNQQQILAHPATAGFISHCGWNSVMEAAQRGIPVLAWPQHGEQRLNAEVMEKAGLGIFDKTWNMRSERLIKGEEIAEKIVKLMEDIALRNKAKVVRAEASKATESGGTSEEALVQVIERLRQRNISF